METVKTRREAERLVRLGWVDAVYSFEFVEGGTAFAVCFHMDEIYTLQDRTDVRRESIARLYWLNRWQQPVYRLYLDTEATDGKVRMAAVYLTPGSLSKWLHDGGHPRYWSVTTDRFLSRQEAEAEIERLSPVFWELRVAGNLTALVPVRQEGDRWIILPVHGKIGREFYKAEVFDRYTSYAEAQTARELIAA